MSNWTQSLPKASGYYWFSMEYWDSPILLYFETGEGYVETYGYFYNDPLVCETDCGYWFSQQPVQPISWT